MKNHPIQNHNTVKALEEYNNNDSINWTVVEHGISFDAAIFHFVFVELFSADLTL